MTERVSQALPRLWSQPSLTTFTTFMVRGVSESYKRGFGAETIDSSLDLKKCQSPNKTAESPAE